MNRKADFLQNESIRDSFEYIRIAIIFESRIVMLDIIIMTLLTQHV